MPSRCQGRSRGLPGKFCHGGVPSAPPGPRSLHGSACTSRTLCRAQDGRPGGLSGPGEGAHRLLRAICSPAAWHALARNSGASRTSRVPAAGSLGRGQGVCLVGVEEEEGHVCGDAGSLPAATLCPSGLPSWAKARPVNPEHTCLTLPSQPNHRTEVRFRTQRTRSQSWPGQTSLLQGCRPWSRGHQALDLWARGTQVPASPAQRSAPHLCKSRGRSRGGPSHKLPPVPPVQPTARDPD